MRIHYDEWGRLVFTSDAGVAHVGVELTRAFPISDPRRGISLIDGRGTELLWIDDLDLIDGPNRAILENELNRRHFLPVLKRVVAIDGITEPTTWNVETDRGPANFQVKSEEDVRRVAGSRVLVVDTHGIRYLIPDYRALDAGSRRLLERYI